MTLENATKRKKIRIGVREVTIPVDWNHLKLQDLIKESGSGEWGEESPTETYYKEAQVLRSGDISISGELSTDEIATRYLSEEDYEKYALSPGDVVIVSSSGSERHIGKKWLAPESINEGKYHFTNFLYRIRLDRTKCDPKYVYYFLSSEYEESFLKSITPTSEFR